MPVPRTHPIPGDVQGRERQEDEKPPQHTNNADNDKRNVVVLTPNTSIVQLSLFLVEVGGGVVPDLFLLGKKEMVLFRQGSLFASKFSFGHGNGKENLGVSDRPGLVYCNR